MQTSLSHYKTYLAAILFILSTVPMSLVAQDVSIEDFRIPETKYQRFLGGLSGSWNKADQASTSSYNGSMNKLSSSSNSSNGQVSLDYITNNFNEDYSFQLSLSANGYASINKSESNQETAIPANINSNSENNYNLSFRPYVNYSKYIIPDRWYVYAQAYGSYSYYEDRQVNNTNTVYDSTYNKDNNWLASPGLGIGYGKMRNGFPVFGVLRLLDKLEEDSMLVRALTKEEILRLVSIFTKRDEYAISHERYIKYFMDDIFAELQKMGVLKNNVPLTYSVARAIEVLSEQIEPRLFGWRVQLGFQKTFNETNAYRDNNDHSPYFNQYYYWDSRNFINLSSEIGHALSLNLHMYSMLAVDVPTIDYNRKINFNFRVNGIYQIGERIDASLSYMIGRTHFLNTVDQDYFSRVLNSEIRASFRFFIENHVSFTVSGGYVESDQYSYSPYGTSMNTRKAPQISFGVNYRFF